MLQQLQDRIAALGIHAEFTDACVEQISKDGYDPIYGARPLRRAITTEIEDRLSEKLLEGTLKSGEGEATVMIDYRDGQFVFEKKEPKEEKPSEEADHQ